MSDKDAQDTGESPIAETGAGAGPVERVSSEADPDHGAPGGPRIFRRKGAPADQADAGLGEKLDGIKNNQAIISEKIDSLTQARRNLQKRSDS